MGFRGWDSGFWTLGLALESFLVSLSGSLTGASVRGTQKMEKIKETQMETGMMFREFGFRGQIGI